MTRFRTRNSSSDHGRLSEQLGTVISPARSPVSTHVPSTIHVQHARAATPSTDVCRFLFERCKEFQAAILDPVGLTCMFDVDAGQLPLATCETLAAVVRNRLRHVALSAEPPGGTLNVTLRHRAPMWALAVSDTSVRRQGPRLAQRELAFMRAHADQLEGAYVIQSIEDGTLIAVLFSDEPGVLCADVLAEGRHQFTH